MYLGNPNQREAAGLSADSSCMAEYSYLGNPNQREAQIYLRIRAAWLNAFVWGNNRIINIKKEWHLMGVRCHKN